MLPFFHRRWLLATLVAAALAGCHLIGDVEDLNIVDDGSGAGTGTGTGTSSGTATGTGTGTTTGSGTGTTTGTNTGTGPTCDLDACNQTAPLCSMAVSCDGQQCVLEYVTLGTGCGGSWVCDGQGSCVECIENTAYGCTDAICLGTECQPPGCNDGIQNGDETDQDCGGSCSACGVGKHCLVPSHCTTNYCLGEVCTPCTDHVQCGGTQYCGNGTCAAKKDDYQACSQPSADYECTSGNCGWDLPCLFTWCCLPS